MTRFLLELAIYFLSFTMFGLFLVHVMENQRAQHKCRLPLGVTWGAHRRHLVVHRNDGCVIRPKRGIAHGRTGTEFVGVKQESPGSK